MIAVPTLDELARDPARAAGLPIEVIASLLAKNAAAQSALAVAALLVSKTGDVETEAPATVITVADDTWLTPDEAALILRRKPRWIYRNAVRLPFVRKVSGRGLLCSEKGLNKWLERQKV